MANISLCSLCRAIDRSEIIDAMAGKNPAVTILVLLMSQIDGSFGGYFVRYSVSVCSLIVWSLLVQEQN